MAFRIGGRDEGSRHIPSVFKSRRDYLGRDACKEAGIHQRHFPAIKRNNAVCRFIASLFSIRSPSAISGLIVAVVIGITVYRKLGRRLASHVGEEGLITAAPSLADRYTSPPVVWIILVIRIVATGQYCSPSPILRRRFAGFCIAMLCKASSCHLRQKTPATCDLAGSQMHTKHLFFGATLALAQKTSQMSATCKGYASLAEYGQSPKLVADHRCARAHESKAHRLVVGTDLACDMGRSMFAG